MPVCVCMCAREVSCIWRVLVSFVLVCMKGSIGVDCADGCIDVCVCIRYYYFFVKYDNL